MKVLGIEVVDYVNKNHQRIQGTKLHLGYTKENCEGYCVMSEFIRTEVVCNVKIGDFIELLYSKFGKVISINILPSEKINF